MKFIKGNIFDSDCTVLVNPVNCEGVMGAGLALEFRLRYPQMFARYQSLCEDHILSVGKLWIYDAQPQKVLNFPTKTKWKAPTKTAYLIAGLKKFVNTYQTKNISSIAFPLLGAGRGGIAPAIAQDIMEEYLSGLPIDIEVYSFDPYATDRFYEGIKSKVLELSVEELASKTMISAKTLDKIITAMHSDKICQFNQLLQTPGVGVRSMEKIIDFSLAKNIPVQGDLF